MTFVADDVSTWREELAHARTDLEQARSAILQLCDLLAAKVESDHRSAVATRLQAVACGFLARLQRLAVFRPLYVASWRGVMHGKWRRGCRLRSTVLCHSELHRYCMLNNTRHMGRQGLQQGWSIPHSSSPS
jgi:hypothetical protein